MTSSPVNNSPPGSRTSLMARTLPERRAHNPLFPEEFRWVIFACRNRGESEGWDIVVARAARSEVAASRDDCALKP